MANQMQDLGQRIFATIWVYVDLFQSIVLGLSA